jgi:hypothetical protein
MTTWDAERDLEMARKAYAYVARTLPPDATLEAIGRTDRAVLEAEERQDFAAYEEALRGLCKVARREAGRAGHAPSFSHHLRPGGYPGGGTSYEPL